MTTITYNGVTKTLLSGEKNTLKCADKILKDDIVINGKCDVFCEDFRKIIEEGQEAVIACSNQKILSDIIIFTGAQSNSGTEDDSDAGLYDENDVMLASWDELVNDYGLDVEMDYSDDSSAENYYETVTSSPYYILNNNEKFSTVTKIIISSNIYNIGNYAFKKCANLTNIEIPNGVKYIDDYAFNDCTGLTNIEIPNSVKEIGIYAFSNCTSLVSVIIPNSVTYLGWWVFSYCTSLTNIEIPNSVTNIASYAFHNCTSLVSVIIPNSVTSIGTGAFQSCKNLTNIEIPNRVTYIGEHVFHNCTSLTSIEIPNSVTNIASYAFGSCYSLVNIEIPNSVKRIGSYAFSYCTSLVSVIIPNSVTTIDSDAFRYCTKSTIYCEAESQPSGWSSGWNYSNCPVVWGHKQETGGEEVQNLIYVLDNETTTYSFNVGSATKFSDLSFPLYSNENSNTQLLASGTNFLEIRIGSTTPAFGNVFLDDVDFEEITTSHDIIYGHTYYSFSTHSGGSN